MRVVDRPVMTPMHCAVLTHIGDQHPNMRWLDTGNTLEGWTDRVYVCEAAVRQCMSLLGYPMPEEYAAMLERAEGAEGELLEIHAELADAERKVEAVAVLQAAGFKARAAA